MKTLTILLSIAVLGLSTLPVPASAQEGADDRWRFRPTIVGTWQVEVTIRTDGPDCTTQPEVPFGPNPFPALNTFNVGGTMTETGSRSPPSRRGPGHGVWERTGGHNFETRYTFQSYDENGLLSSNADIRSQISVAANGLTFSGVSRLLFTDISGNARPFCGTLSGIRLTL